MTCALNHVTEEYEVTVELNGKRSHVSRGRSQTRPAHRDATHRISKLEIIDTAGVEQFTGINESYIQVCIPDCMFDSSCTDLHLFRQRGLGFVLVFRYVFWP